MIPSRSRRPPAGRNAQPAFGWPDQLRHTEPVEPLYSDPDYGGPDKIVFLKSRRLFLRPVLREDIHLFLQWLNDEDVRHLFMKRAMPIDEAEAEAWFGTLHKRSDAVSFTVCVNDGPAIGMIGLHSIDWRNRIAATEAVIGNKRFRGKGYATEAKLLLLRYAFDTLNLYKIWGTIFSFNKASQAYNKRCGYKVEGIQRKQIFVNGKYHDRIFIGVFRDDWKRALMEFNRAWPLKS